MERVRFIAEFAKGGVNSPHSTGVPVACFPADFFDAAESWKSGSFNCVWRKERTKLRSG